MSKPIETVKSGFISYLFLFFSFFPYIKIVETGSDLQPLSFIIGIIYLIVRGLKVKFDTQIFYLIITLFFASAFFFWDLVQKLDLVPFRGLYGYLSIVVHSVVAYDIFKRNRKICANIIENVIYIWFFVGLIQNFISSSFMSFMLSRGGSYDPLTAGGRGVIGLAVEPTFYGIHCFVLFLFVTLIYRSTSYYSSKKNYFLSALCLIQILVFARSSMVTLFLLLILAIITFDKVFTKPLYAVVMLVFIVGLIVIASSNINQNTRLYTLGTVLINSPAEILIADRSVNERVSDIFFSIKGFVEYPFGYGLNGWQNYLNKQPNNLVFVKTEQTRIMSFIGAFLFEVGIFSILTITYIGKRLNTFFSILGKKNPMYLIVAFLILLTAIQSSYPPLWLFFSSLLVLKDNGKSVTPIINPKA